MRPRCFKRVSDRNREDIFCGHGLRLFRTTANDHRRNQDRSRNPPHAILEYLMHPNSLHRVT